MASFAGITETHWQWRATILWQFTNLDFDVRDSIVLYIIITLASKAKDTHRHAPVETCMQLAVRSTVLTCVNSWQKLAPVNLAWTPRRFSARSHGLGHEPKSGWEFRLQSTETRVKRQGLYRCYRCLTYICLFAKTNEQQKSELFGSALSQTRKKYTCYTEMGSRWLPQKNASGKTLMRHFACSTLEVYGSSTWSFALRQSYTGFV